METSEPLVTLAGESALALIPDNSRAKGSLGPGQGKNLKKEQEKDTGTSDISQNPIGF